MAERRYLKNAPITEAIIDLRVEFGSSIDISIFGDAHGQIREDYPTVHIGQEFTGELEFTPDQPPKQKSGYNETTGFAYTSVDETQVVQFGINGFTFSKLKPYTSWEEIFPEAMRLWKIYSQSSKPSQVTRLATRFINQISIPTPFDSFGAFLTAPPIVPPNTSQLLSAFLTQVTVIPDPNSRTAINITQSLAPISDASNAVVLLDVDAFEFFDTLTPSDEQTIVKVFHKLRDLKNLTFFDSLTERAMDLFQ